MWAGMREMGKLVTVRWPGLAGAGGVAATLWLLGFRLQLYAGQRRRERRVEEELVAYARLNVQLPGDKDGRELAGQLSRLVAEKSAFHRVAMLIADAGGRLSVASSRGIDDTTVQWLNVWGEGLAGASGKVALVFGGEMAGWECGWEAGALRWFWARGRRRSEISGRL